MSKRKENIKMTIFIMVAGIGLIIAGVIGIVTSRIDSREYKNSTDIRKIPAVIVDLSTKDDKDDSGDVINLKFHMLLTEKPTRENMKNVSGQGRAATQKNIPMIN